MGNLKEKVERHTTILYPLMLSLSITLDTHKQCRHILSVQESTTETVFSVLVGGARRLDREKISPWPGVLPLALALQPWGSNDRA